MDCFVASLLAMTWMAPVCLEIPNLRRLLDHPVRDLLQLGRHIDAELLCRLQVEPEFDLDRLLNGQIGGMRISRRGKTMREPGD